MTNTPTGGPIRNRGMRPSDKERAGGISTPDAIVPSAPIVIVEKPAETDREATSRYYQPYYALAEHTALIGLNTAELNAVAVLREGVTLAELNRRLTEAKQNARFGFENVIGAWVPTLEELVGIREDAAQGFAQKLKKAHFDHLYSRRG